MVALLLQRKPRLPYTCTLLYVAYFYRFRCDSSDALSSSKSDSVRPADNVLGGERSPSSPIVARPRCAWRLCTAAIDHGEAPKKVERPIQKRRNQNPHTSHHRVKLSPLFTGGTPLLAMYHINDNGDIEKEGPRTHNQRKIRQVRRNRGENAKTTKNDTKRGCTQK